MHLLERHKCYCQVHESDESECVFAEILVHMIRAADADTLKCSQTTLEYFTVKF